MKIKTIMVPCTKCGAEAGKLCRRPGGQLYAAKFFVHKARRIEARQIMKLTVWLVTA